ncbi:hypothetical protein GC101_22300 [Paenibacillus sp. LMG 31459]|uniref:Uncharacterized protein n=1 Tax=Paenibacillus phytohabitans TaxID=2654978 RepID=A0ABX1YKN0_9BACL|nr:hypothetical protein [Paenibacillus phytohabitans]NOU81597.1 hypothetical protein [Paenibacillus phytohabitans]
MKKKGLLVTLLLVLSLPVSGVNAFASSSSTSETGLNALSKIDVVQKKVIDPNLSVEKYMDGRVVGVDNVDTLNESQKTKILKEMRFNSEEINAMPEQLKDDLLESGGVKVDINTEISEEYHSLDGKTYIVDESNKELIQKIKDADLKEIQKDSVTSQMQTAKNSVNDGAFSAYHSLLYSGKTSNAKEFVYSYLTYYSMSTTILPGAIDKVGTAWNVNATRTGAVAYSYLGNSGYQVSVDVSSVYGTSTSYLPETYTRGYMKNDVNIPVSYVGTTTNFASAYAHPYALVSPAVSFGPLAVSFSSFIGSQWSWGSSFTVGATSLNP